jgi:hypothetical protein
VVYDEAKRNSYALTVFTYLKQQIPPRCKTTKKVDSLVALNNRINECLEERSVEGGDENVKVPHLNLTALCELYVRDYPLRAAPWKSEEVLRLLHVIFDPHARTVAAAKLIITKGADSRVNLDNAQARPKHETCPWQGTFESVYNDEQNVYKHINASNSIFGHIHPKFHQFRSYVALKSMWGVIKATYGTCKCHNQGVSGQNEDNSERDFADFCKPTCPHIKSSDNKLRNNPTEVLLYLDELAGSNPAMMTLVNRVIIRDHQGDSGRQRDLPGSASSGRRNKKLKTGDGDGDEDQQSIAKMVLKEIQDSKAESSKFLELYKDGLSADKESRNLDTLIKMREYRSKVPASETDTLRKIDLKIKDLERDVLG